MLVRPLQSTIGKQNVTREIERVEIKQRLEFFGAKVKGQDNIWLILPKSVEPIRKNFGLRHFPHKNFEMCLEGEDYSCAIVNENDLFFIRLNPKQYKVKRAVKKTSPAR